MTIDHGSTTKQDGRLDEVLGEYFETLESGHAPDREGLLARHPDLAPELAAFFADQDRFHQITEIWRIGETSVSPVFGPAPDHGRRFPEHDDVGFPCPVSSQGAEKAAGTVVLGSTCPDPGVATLSHVGGRGGGSAGGAVALGSTRPDSEPVAPPQDLATPTEGRPFGNYFLLQRLGGGGMGVVFRARDRRLGRVVALKTIKAGEFASPLDVLRFHMEVDTIAQLDHPHIVPIHEVDQYLGQLYFSMKLMEGGSLSGMLRIFVDEPTAGARLMVPIARAVHYVHQRGILHRDLKPSNILLDREGRPHVADFGLAKRVDGGVDLTLSGGVLGTPEYMAPEQASGAKESVTTATDVYGLGAILYSLLTGQPPFKGRTVLETLEQVRDRVPASPRGINPKVDRDLETICLKCLEKDPQRRYESAEALAQVLERRLRGERIDDRPPGLCERLRFWARRHQAVASLSAALVLVVVSSLGVIGWQWHRMQVEQWAHAQVEALFTATPEAVPSIIRDLRPFHVEAVPLLRQYLGRGDLPEAIRARFGVALLPYDPGLVDDLERWMLRAEPRELGNLREALRPYGRRLRDGLWKLVEDPRADRNRRFRAACALAMLDPGDAVRWGRCGPDVVDHFIAEPPTSAGPWIELLRPVRHHLLDPLRAAFKGSDRPEPLLVAALALAEYVDRPGPLAELIETAKPGQVEVLVGRLRDRDRSGVISRLDAKLARQVAPEVAGADREDLTHRQANAAAALLMLGRGERIWPLLRHEPDPRLRPELIHRLGPAGVDPDVLFGRLRTEPNPESRRALILALGEIPTHRLPPARRESLVHELLQSYRDDPDSGIHSALDWLLRRWGLGDRLASLPDEPTPRVPVGGRLWYINGQGHTMAVLADPQSFSMGSPEADPGQEHSDRRPEQRTPAPFAIATTEVTVAQFLRLIPEHGYSTDFSPELDCPINNVNYFDALRYCRRLSEMEGIPEDQMCYPPVDEIGPEMGLPRNYLERIGYRLPTEEEWEYACRAGTAGIRPSGPSDAMLRYYVWYVGNSMGRTWPVGSLKPNDFGLFDTLGNVFELCHLSYMPRTLCDGEFQVGAVLRGSIADGVAKSARSSRRVEVSTSYRFRNHGFRVARTFRSPAPEAKSDAVPPSR